MSITDTQVLDYLENEIKQVRATPDMYRDCFDLACVLEDDKERKSRLLKLSAAIERNMPALKIEAMSQVYSLHEQVLLELAPDDFESYLLFMEWKRDPDKRFYMPRRKILRHVVEAMQQLHDDELDLLAVSLPPGTGKSTLAIFFQTWLAGLNPDEPILTGSHSNAFVRQMYDEVLRMIVSEEYQWSRVFPGVKVSGTNAKECRIDLGPRKRFETLEYTSLGSGNAGLYRAVQLLYCDDLVSSIEEALSKERLDKRWTQYTVDLTQRKQGNHCKELHIATRWSVHDIIGRLERENENNPRAKFIVIPALNKNDESNFDYDYGVGYSTATLHKQRDTMDSASWKALYMNEPIEREGLLYDRDQLRRYFDLPDKEPDAILSICDTKDRGTDYAVMPVAYQYGQDFYIDDVVCSNDLPEIVDPLLVQMLLRHNVNTCRFESNSAGGRVAKDVAEEVKKRGGRTSITTKFTTQNKETKIITQSGYVKEHFLFKDDSLFKPNSQYGVFLNMLCSYTMAGKNKHDDAPDACAMLAEYVQSLSGQSVTVFNRPF